ncbi:hypothetical protein NRB20_57330 [Nocardia sp. RB20]|uniref:HTH tetR-type domain-containing protein n=2 Tax=Nocardia macrotermitis TaxID=2585198 RepID=A0A7K0DA25_9NOCA|nr:hypothetical protein [Nocardia macrotermitis]
MPTTQQRKPWSSPRARADETVADLLGAARDLFARNGYAATSLDAVCEAAQLSKGALYHHFGSKQLLFRAVYEKEQERIAARVVRAYAAAAKDPATASDAWGAVLIGAKAFLDEVLEPDVQRINLMDAPGALGWEDMRELGGDCLRMMEEGVARAVATGDIGAHSVPALARLLYGALCETAMGVARAADPEQALRESMREVDGLFGAVRLAR